MKIHHAQTKHNIPLLCTCSRQKVKNMGIEREGRNEKRTKSFRKADMHSTSPPNEEQDEKRIGERKKDRRKEKKLAVYSDFALYFQFDIEFLFYYYFGETSDSAQGVYIVHCATAHKLLYSSSEFW